MIKTLPFKTLLLALISVFGFGIMSTQAAAIVFADLNLENGVQYADPFDGGDFTVTFGGGGNNGKYYTTGTGIRVYGDGTMKVAAKSGNVTSVTITFDGSNKPTTADVVNCGTYDPETGVWTGKFSSVTFTRPSGSGHWRIKSVDATVEAGTPIDPDGGTDPGVDPQDYATVTLPYEESFISSQGQFVTENNAQGGLDAVWKTSQYGMTANGYGCTSAIMYASLVSPYIDATSTSTLTMTFDENLRYFGGENQVEQEAMVEVREKGGNWQRIEVPTRVLANNNNFTNVGVIDLSQYAGKVFQIQFNYWADTSAPGRWEIKNLSIQAGEVVVKQDAELSFAESNWTVTIGESNTFPELVNPNNLPVTWSSSKTDVATIDEATGAIELLAAGQTIINASFAGNDYFNEGSASYQLVVEEQEIPGTDKYVLVTDASTLAAGDKIILVGVTDDGAYAMSTTQNSNNRAANAVTIEDNGCIIPSSAIQKITLEEGFYFNVGNGYLYAASAGSNWLRTEAEADDNARATIDIDAETGDATIVFQGENTRNNMRFNPNSGNPMFSCYAETSSVKTLPRIYRFYDGEIIVKQDVATIDEVEPTSVACDETGLFTPVITPADGATFTQKWSSDNEEVLTVLQNGMYLALAEGTANVTLTLVPDDTEHFNQVSTTFAVTVVKVYQTIAEFIAANTTGQLNVDGAQVLYVDPAMKNIYIADASAAICLFNNAGFETGLSAGDILGGTLTGKYSPYKNLPEITNVDLSTVYTTDKKDVVPVIIDATADDMAANLCRVVKMEKAEVTEEAGKFYVGDVQVYDNFKLNYEIAEGTYDILGIAIIFNSTYEICPIEAPTKVSDVPVGISALALQPSDIIFDLQGRRVMQPQKGMYIVNGKVVVIK